MLGKDRCTTRDKGNKSGRRRHACQRACRGHIGPASPGAYSVLIKMRLTVQQGLQCGQDKVGQDSGGAFDSTQMSLLPARLIDMVTLPYIRQPLVQLGR